ERTVLAFSNGADHGEGIGPEFVEGVRAPLPDASRQHGRDAPDQAGPRGTAHRTRSRLLEETGDQIGTHACALLKIGARGRRPPGHLRLSGQKTANGNGGKGDRRADEHLDEREAAAAADLSFHRAVLVRMVCRRTAAGCMIPAETSATGNTTTVRM